MAAPLTRFTLLLVEPRDASREVLRAAVGQLAAVEAHADFAQARRRLGATPFDFLVTNLRLGAYNGLHLVYLAASFNRGLTRAIVYSNELDVGIAREVQLAGAFYELRTSLPAALHSYLRAPLLPPRDRRNPAIRDRRAQFRGGRRGSDLPLPGPTN
jgi:DNA-binding NtrC family response regulator